jgi:threonine/homoserine/homoserine lactone efflux protein
VQVLTLSALPAWQYHAYLLLYILVFMLDDLLIFVIAMKTLQVTGLTGRYARWSHLIGGGLLLLIGILLLLRPEWLSF